jgi:hypothetical protein
MMTTVQQGEVHQMDDTIVTDEDAEVLAERAAAAIRDLNHAVQPAKGELTYPADVYKILGSLEALAGWLPQASGQLARWLDSQAEAGRLRATDCGPFSDVPAAVAAATHWLQQAGDSAEQLRLALGTAHEVISGLAYVHDTGQKE